MVNKLPTTCRPAKESDTADILDLTRHIWDGEDYVPHVWNEWLADPTGLLAVCEYQGKVVGLGKLTQLVPDDWWMEGLRVHPEFEGHGIASQLHDYLVNYWEGNGSGALRLATSAERVQVHHLCERTDFHRIGEFGFFKAEVLEGATPDIHPLTTDQVSDAMELINHHPAMSLSYGLMDLGWQWSPPTPELIQKAVYDGRAFCWRANGSEMNSLILFWEDRWENSEHRRKPVPMVQLILCSIDELGDHLQDFRRLSAGLGYKQVGWLAPLQPSMEGILDAAGFQREWDGSLVVFARE